MIGLRRRTLRHKFDLYVENMECCCKNVRAYSGLARCCLFLICTNRNQLGGFSAKPPTR